MPKLPQGIDKINPSLMFVPSFYPSGGEAESGQAAAITGDISSLGPGAYGADGDLVPKIPAYIERMTTDMGALKKQYKKLRQRQKQAHIILSG